MQYELLRIELFILGVLHLSIRGIYHLNRAEDYNMSIIILLSGCFNFCFYLRIGKKTMIRMKKDSKKRIKNPEKENWCQNLVNTKHLLRSYI